MPPSDYPAVDQSRDRLHRAGWSVAEAASGSACLVSGTNGENRPLLKRITARESEPKLTPQIARYWGRESR